MQSEPLVSTEISDRTISDLYDALSLLSYRIGVNGTYDAHRDAAVLAQANFALEQAQRLVPHAIAIGAPAELVSYEVEVRQVVVVSVPQQRYDLALQEAIKQAVLVGAWKTTLSEDSRSVPQKLAGVEPLGVEIARASRNLLVRMRGQKPPSEDVAS